MSYSTGVRSDDNKPLNSLAQGIHADMPIIGVGGVMSGADAAAKAQAGASLVQLYSGFIYRGPALIGEAVEAIRAVL